MADTSLRALNSAILRILRPLVRILLRHGVSHKDFSELAKAVYVDVAESDFTLPGRKQSTSRISVLTGLTRKEVARLRGSGEPGDGDLASNYNRAARVIAGWARDARYHDADGDPARLPFEGEQASFSELVRRFSGDIPPKTMLDELLRVGAVREKQGRIELVSRSYVPQRGAEDKLHILGTDVAYLAATIEHNIEQPDNPHFQRKVAYDNLPEEAVAEFRALSREKAQRLIEELDSWLSRHDRDGNPAVEGTGRKQAGLGIYYFEEDGPGEK
jgi:hypothetical protein